LRPFAGRDTYLLRYTAARKRADGLFGQAALACMRDSIFLPGFIRRGAGIPRQASKAAEENKSCAGKPSRPFLKA